MSAAAQAIKLADVIANVRDVREDPDPSWSPERKADYVRYALDVLNGILDPNLELAAALRREVRAFHSTASPREEVHNELQAG